MLHYKTIDSKTLELLKKLLCIPAFSNLRLVGGTGLALQIGHRISIDLDLFGKIEADEFEVTNSLGKTGKVTILKKSENINENVHPFLIYGLLFLIGFLNGSLSAGTGLLYTLMLTKIYGMSFKQAIGYTLLVVGLFFNLIGALTLYLISTIDLNILPLLIIGSFFGGYVGAMIAISKSNKFIKTAYQFVTLIVAYKLLF